MDGSRREDGPGGAERPHGIGGGTAGPRAAADEPIAPEAAGRAAGAGSAAEPAAARSEPVAAAGVAPGPPVPRRRARLAAWAVAAGALVALAAAALVALASNGTWYEAQWVSLPGGAGSSAVPASTPPSTAVTSVALATGASAPAAALPAAFSDLAPRGVYLTVDTWANRLRVYRGGALLREAVCSTGSRTVLKDPVGGRTWVFDTPLGERRVERKVRNPVWIKPDWAFVEQGFLPPKDFRQRVDDVSLGDYGLYLGDGYIIHGTLFQSLLGRPLTHGCIRLGDEDLEYVYRTTPVGARVYLY